MLFHDANASRWVSVCVTDVVNVPKLVVSDVRRAIADAGVSMAAPVCAMKAPEACDKPTSAARVPDTSVEVSVAPVSVVSSVKRLRCVS